MKTCSPSVLTALSAVVLATAGSGLLMAADPDPGLAARYPGDAGIAKDAKVVFADDFESGDIAALKQRWTEVNGRTDKILALAGDSPPGSGGKHALQATAHPPADSGGHLYKKLDRGYDKLHARFCVKFPDKAGYIHHFVTLGGYRPATAWAQGGAGNRPRGDDRITVGIEPFGENGRHDPPGIWNFYAYWHEMKISAGNRYWGNAIAPVTPLKVPAGKWQCVEMMIALNTVPEKADGELALWLDGQPAMRIAKGTPRNAWTGLGFTIPEKGGEPFEGFRWRNSMDLQLNFFWLMHYVTQPAIYRNKREGLPAETRVWFDNIVIATDYIGPVAALKP